MLQVQRLIVRGKTVEEFSQCIDRDIHEMHQTIMNNENAYDYWHSDTEVTICYQCVASVCQEKSFRMITYKVIDEYTDHYKWEEFMRHLEANCLCGACPHEPCYEPNKHKHALEYSQNFLKWLKE